MSQSPGELKSERSWQSTISAGSRFSLVGLLGYSMWAFGPASTSGAAVLYTACAVVFIVLGGIALFPVVRGRVGFLKFCLVFSGAFAGFAVIWCLVYFVLKGKHGEVLGFLFG